MGGLLLEGIMYHDHTSRVEIYLVNTLVEKLNFEGLFSENDEYTALQPLMSLFDHVILGICIK